MESLPKLSRNDYSALRGFISGKPVSSTVEIGIHYASQGFIDSGITVVPVADLPAAREILARHKITDPITRPLFLIDEKEEISFAKDYKEKRSRFVDLLMRSPLISVHHNNSEEIIFYPVENRSRFNLERFLMMEVPAMPGVKSFVMLGWTFPAERGLLKAEVLRQSKTYKNLQYEARRKHRAGIRFRTNHDFEVALQTLANQRRKGQSGSQNRYAIPAAQNRVRLLYKHKCAFTLEAVDTSVSPHQVLGGILAIKYGKFISIDTTFGNPNSKLSNIDLSRIAAMALSDIAWAQGVPFIDMGMVSEYSRSIKADYYPNLELIEFLNSPASSEDFVLPIEWVPEFPVVHKEVKK